MSNESKCTGISLGFGTVKTKEEIDEEKIKALVEEIEAETKAAGLPWWTGVFNPKLIRLAQIEKSDERKEERKTDAISEMEKANAVRREADEILLKAMHAMSKGMATIDDLIGEKEELKLTPGEVAMLAEKEARIGSAMAQVRMNIGFGVQYGFASGCYCGTGETEEESR